ncbi:unnamed protein product [Durusdinium trenchii]|uniref:Uncharacterized protein n=1 Tax=Durusdinium trenchii TaxID=1381693 RepID=A0ABP0J3P4_9DINO
MAPSAFKSALNHVRIAVTGGGDPRELNVVEAIQLALTWRVARHVYGMEDLDPLSDLGGTASPTAATTPAQAQCRVPRNLAFVDANGRSLQVGNVRGPQAATGQSCCRWQATCGPA